MMKPATFLSALHPLAVTALPYCVTTDPFPGIDIKISNAPHISAPIRLATEDFVGQKSSISTSLWSLVHARPAAANGKTNEILTASGGWVDRTEMAATRIHVPGALDTMAREGGARAKSYAHTDTWYWATIEHGAVADRVWNAAWGMCEMGTIMKWRLQGAKGRAGPDVVVVGIVLLFLVAIVAVERLGAERAPSPCETEQANEMINVHNNEAAQRPKSTVQAPTIRPEKLIADENLGSARDHEPCESLECF